LSTGGLQKRQARLVTVRERIPVTTPARTIADLHGAVCPYLVRKATRQADFLGLALGGIETDRTRSDLERDFLRLCRRHGLPPPEVNAPVGRWTVDFLWREEQLAVETDSYATHGGRTTFEDDRRRDLELRRAGFAVHRFSELQLEAEPAAVAADVVAALRRDRS
jgi:very-short-patch-repair endonuclease